MSFACHVQQVNAARKKGSTWISEHNPFCCGILRSGRANGWMNGRDMYDYLIHTRSVCVSFMHTTRLNHIPVSRYRKFLRMEMLCKQHRPYAIASVCITTYENDTEKKLYYIFWFGDFYFIKITTYCVEKWICLFFFSRYGRQLLWFYTWFHSNQLTDDWLKIIIIYIYSLRFPAKNYLLISSSIATIWCNIGQVHMKYLMIII